MPRGGGGGVASSERRDKGVDPELLRSLPVTVYRAGATAKGPAGEDNDTDAGVPDEAPVLTRVVVGDEVEDEVGARALGLEVEPREIEEAEGAEGGLVERRRGGEGGRRGLQRVEAELGAE